MSQQEADDDLIGSALSNVTEKAKGLRNKKSKNLASVEYSLNAKLSFNVSIVGKKNCGKTSLILREIKNIYGKLPTNSQGFQYYSKNYHRNGEEFSLQIWDTAGNSEYKSMTRNFFRKASCIVLVFTDVDTLEKQLTQLLKELDEYANDSVKLGIVRAKIDLIQQAQTQFQPSNTTQSQPQQQNQNDNVKITATTHQQNQVKDGITNEIRKQNIITTDEKTPLSDTERIQACVEKYSIFHWGQTSAKQKTGVHQFFKTLMEKLHRCYEEDESFRNIIDPKGDSFVLSTLDKHQKFGNKLGQKKKGACC